MQKPNEEYPVFTPVLEPNSRANANNAGRSTWRSSIFTETSPPIGISPNFLIFKILRRKAPATASRPNAPSL